MVQKRYDQIRGCGIRQKGLYLVGGQLSSPCGKLPIPLDNCPTCNCGIKFSRAPRWVSPEILRLDRFGCEYNFCGSCTFSSSQKDDMILICIGKKFYPTPQDFLMEAREQGISRRIPAIPKGFEPGKTRILLAHPECSFEVSGEWTKGLGVIGSFVPHAIEYVVDGKESDKELSNLIKRGVTPVSVEVVTSQKTLFG